MAMIRISIGLTVTAILCASVGRAQEFSYGTDTVFNARSSGSRLSGELGGGFASAYMKVLIDDNQLTAILRNTSPDDRNGLAGFDSPAITRFDFNVTDLAGGPAKLIDWQMRGVDQSGNSVVLGSYKATSNVWKARQIDDGTLRVHSNRRRRHALAPLYNPSTTSGFQSNARFFSEAVFTATFATRIGSSDLNSQVRFDYVGKNSRRKNLAGVRLASNASPEPASLITWCFGGALAACGLKRRPRRNRRV